MNEIERFSARDRQVSDHTRRYIEHGVPAATRTAYTSELTRFTKWCASNQRSAIPATAETLTEFVGMLCRSGLARSSIRRAMSAVATAHRASGAEPPDTTGANVTLRGYVRTGEAAEVPRTGQAPALLMADLRKLVDACDATTPIGTRDRALILLGWAMMARRSELTALDVADVMETDEGLDVFIRQSKTDQDATGATVSVPFGEHSETCPVRALAAWLGTLGANGQTSGPLFRPIDKHGRLGGDPKFAGRSHSPRMTPQAVEVVMRRAATASGLTSRGYRPHSLRAGPVTQAYLSGRDPLAVSRHGRWADKSPVFLGYIREAERKKNNPMKGIGL